MASPAARGRNRLADATSPYLLQHAGNPVDWHPWGPEALRLARERDRPIFLSIGYSACHWCHVMERECFESQGIAALMNEHFVNIKVDREERPDLDAIYMRAVQALSGSGGWPMSVFLTPDLEPFFGGTYFPPVPRGGQTSFPQVLQWIADRWVRSRSTLIERGARLAAAIAEEGRAGTRGELDPGVLDRSFQDLVSNFDPLWGGFGGPPKFPRATDLRVLLRHWKRTGDEQALQMVSLTLDRMAGGGMHDQLAGGFHRYSTDERWLVPHFEKMLYDSALLVPAYLEGYLAVGRAQWAQVARGCCDWMVAEMATPEGGFASSIDADSEGEEGVYYTWTPAELERALGDRQAAWAADWFGIDATGNFERGRSIPWREDAPEDVARRAGVPLAELCASMEQARRRLLQVRSLRPRPATDDKVLTSWNGLAISALAQSWQVLREGRHLAAAQRAAHFLLSAMRRPDGRLASAARAGRVSQDGFLEDHAFLIQGLIDLYEADFDERWLREALALEAQVETLFVDAREGGYFQTASDHEHLIARLKNPQDGALPSGNGVHALSLLRLAELTGSAELARRAERTITSMGALVNRHPAAFGQLLLALDFLAAGPREIVIAGPPEDTAVQAMLAVVRGTFLPQRVVVLAREGADEGLVPLVRGRTPRPGEVVAHVCRAWTCRVPARTPEELAAQLRA